MPLWLQANRGYSRRIGRTPTFLSFAAWLLRRTLNPQRPLVGPEALTYCEGFCNLQILTTSRRNVQTIHAGVPATRSEGVHVGDPMASFQSPKRADLLPKVWQTWLCRGRQQGWESQWCNGNDDGGVAPHGIRAERFGEKPLQGESSLLTTEGSQGLENELSWYSLQTIFCRI